MEKALSRIASQNMQANLSRVRQSFVAVSGHIMSAADFVWNGLFSSQIVRRQEPGVSEETRNEGVDRVRYCRGRDLF